MEIRRSEACFLNDLRDLYLESRQNTFTWLDSNAFQLSDFDSDTKGEEVWVAIENNQVLGFISVWDKEGFIHHLYVQTPEVNKGIGSQLLAKIMDYYPRLTLKCFTLNTHAVRFYTSKGFTIIDTTHKADESYHTMRLEAYS
ncbi:GNAT family N-acetyltransferase [Vibrio sp.]|nr:GNAT family N-acetyltransferase [Vibrio sp.]